MIHKQFFKQEESTPMNGLYQKGSVRQLEITLIAFFVLATLSALGVYIADPSIYAKALLLEPSPTDRYPLPTTLFLVCLVIFIGILIFGVVRHWWWLFWLILVAFGCSVLQIPATIFQLTGDLPTSTPVWYSLFRMGVAVIEGAIALWMAQIYRHSGVWAMGRKKKGSVVQEKEHL
jgi:hypothetical protein